MTKVLNWFKDEDGTGAVTTEDSDGNITISHTIPESGYPTEVPKGRIDADSLFGKPEEPRK